MPTRRKRFPNSPGPGHECRLEELVRECGVPEAQYEAFLAYARELDFSLRRDRRRTPRPGGFSDYSARTKRVVMKWFRRGLCGRLLARVGAALERAVDPREVEDG